MLAESFSLHFTKPTVVTKLKILNTKTNLTSNEKLEKWYLELLLEPSCCVNTVFLPEINQTGCGSVFTTTLQYSTSKHIRIKLIALPNAQIKVESQPFCGGIEEAILYHYERDKSFSDFLTNWNKNLV